LVENRNLKEGKNRLFLTAAVRLYGTKPLLT